MRRTVLALCVFLGLVVSLVSYPMFVNARFAHDSRGHHTWGCNTATCDKRVGRKWWIKHHPKPKTTASTGWAIPYYIVRCESGGKNLAPHIYQEHPLIDPAGYYQIISSTWSGYGGPTDRGKHPNANEWSKSVQDRMARKIARIGGLSEWQCA